MPFSALLFVRSRLSNFIPNIVPHQAKNGRIPSRDQSSYSNLQQSKIRFSEIFSVSLSIVALIIITFWGHITGVKTFPWDFLGGYHFQSFAWYSHGNVFSPPNWFPWGDMGFPAALAIQGGAWYLPISLLDWFGLTYTIELATRIQVFHVGFGSFGMYLLLRVFGFTHLIAILGSVCFFFSSGFYSNQQHVDILRAYALIPWLIWSFHPNKLLNSYLGVPVAIILLWQFFIASYPGIIVSSAYTLGLYFFLNCSQVIERRIIIRYFFACGMVVLIALLLSTLKWIPFFWYHDLYESASIGLNQKAPFAPHHLLTLLFPYDVDFLSSDVTMRSLYLPLVGLLGIFFVVNGTVSVFYGFLFIVSALFFGAFVSSSAWLSEIIPGSRLSRFPLSDWRPFLHIGTIILCCEGWRVFFSDDRKLLRVRSRFVWMLFLFAIVAWIAKDMGYSNRVILKLTLWLIVICALLIGCIALQQRSRFKNFAKPTVSSAVIVSLILVAVFQSLEYHTTQSRPWSVDWSAKISQQLFGVEKISMPNTEPLTVRPERMVIGTGIDEILKNRNSSLYNRCWYEGTYCLFGYNNLKLSIPHNALRKSLVTASEDDELLRFISGSQKLLIFAQGQEIKIHESFSSGSEHSQAVLGVSVEPLSYTADKVIYRISTPQDIHVVENEIWWRGWMVKLCNEVGCMDSYPSKPTSHYLRSWSVPEGDWLVVLEFQPGGVLLSRFLALLGFLLMASWSVASVFFRK